jgi:hypothetical protein
MADPSLAAGRANTDAAATGAIEGTVADSNTGEKLAGVTVIVTSPQLLQTQTAITDENGAYQVGQLPAGEYLVTFYYADITVERSGIQVGIDKTTPVYQKLNMASAASETIEIQMGGIAIDTSRVHMGLPVSRTFGGVLDVEMGVIIANEKRPVIEWSVWGRLGMGVASQRSDVIARRVAVPEARSTSTWEAAVAADLTFGVARHGDLRVGVWGEARTSSEMVAGAELVLEGLPPHPYGSRIGGAGSVVLRAGANDRIVTGALGFGYVGSFPRSDPWLPWARHLVGARVVVSVDRAIDEPHDWSATLGIEVEPIGVVHALFDVSKR